jgi:hypothetical protein
MRDQLSDADCPIYGRKPGWGHASMLQRLRLDMPLIAGLVLQGVGVGVGKLPITLKIAKPPQKENPKDRH